MVNYGVSRACGTCKRRRKKCDEARPACERCIKAKVICQGYQDEAEISFRYYRAKDETEPCQSTGQAFKCQIQYPSLPGHQSTIDSEMEQLALTTFLDDYCLKSKSKSLSRGYLDDLDSLLAKAGPSSDIAMAAKTAAFASLGNKLGNAHLLHEANILYSNLLCSFQATLSKTTTSNTIESLTTAVLLGLYELISATETHPGEHGAHLRGVTAILSSENSPFSRRTVTHITRGAEAKSPSGPLMWPYELGILCPSNSDTSFLRLDDLLSRFAPIFYRNELLNTSKSTSLDEIRQFREYIMSVDEEFALWPSKQPKEWSPKTIGFMAQREAKGLLPGTSLPSRVDIYFDLYVSAVWNLYRKSRLLLLELIYTWTKRLNVIESEDSFSERHILKKAQDLSESIAASVPFHLIRNPEALVHPQRSLSSQPLLPNRSISGLLLMHTIYAVLGLSIVPVHLKEMYREHIAWIGQHMGIGQASLLANYPTSFERKYLADSYVLIWAGTLIP